MARTPLAPENSAIVLIDHEVGFSNLVRSHSVEDTIDGAVALAKIAKAFDMPLVVTAGFDESPAGPLYPELVDVLGDTTVHHRVDGFDAFYDEGFAAAIEATGRQRLIMAGVQTDVCLAQTALTALDRGYEVYGVMDASAATTKETHDLAVQRLVQAGVVPTNWLAIGSELQRSWTEEKTAPGFAKVIYDHLRSWRHQNQLTTSVREFANKTQ